MSGLVKTYVMRRPAHGEAVKRRHWPLVAQLLMAAIAMFGFGYLMVPLYRIVCTALGVNGALPLVQAKPEGDRVIAGQSGSVLQPVEVRFLANLPQGGLFDFKVLNPQLKIVRGKIYEAHFAAHNKESSAVTAQAVVSIQPGAAARHIHKIECFCFTKQHFKAGEIREMPVRFYFDEGLPRSVQEVSLSYALYRLDDQG
jgi:cytochrome c oxidase assembly protein subunit 11